MALLRTKLVQPRLGRLGKFGPTNSFRKALAMLQIVGSRGEIMAIEGGATTSSNVKQVGRSRQYIGTQAVKEMRIVYQGFFVDAATGGNGNTCAELNASNNCIIRASVEINGVVVRVKFNGSLDGQIVSGATKYISDSLLPSQFGLTEFAAGTLMWIKSEREFTVGQKGMFHQTSSNSPTITGESWFVAPTGSTTQLDTAGPLAVVNGWIQQSHVWHPYAVIGIPKKKMIAIGTFGASIENGVNDGLGDGLNGAGGYMRRMLANVNGQKIARIHLAKSGETAKSFVLNSAKRRDMIQYINHALSGHGGNDYSTGESLAATQANWISIWALLRQGGYVKHLEHYGLSPKSDSTDAYATIANQTPRLGYATGGAWRDAGNAFVAAQVGTVLNAYIDLSNAQVDATARDKWRVDLGQPTTDGTHPNAVIAAAMAAQGAPHIEALRVAWEK